jgi:hypothetical protein
MKMKSELSKGWNLLPSPIRKTIVSVFGSTFIVIGLLLSVLPGPFTIPLVILGLLILGIEFAWARRTLEKVKAQGSKLNPKRLFKK